MSASEKRSTERRKCYDSMWCKEGETPASFRYLVTKDEAIYKKVEEVAMGKDSD